MVTIQDVADLAGVSISSVSNVMNGRTEKLSKETFARVRQAIEKLNYRPNQAARQLKTGTASMLGLLVPSTANPMFGEMALHIESAAHKDLGFRLLLSNTYRDQARESRMFDDLHALGVRGVIVVSSQTDEQHMTRAIQNGMAIVSYDRRGAGGEGGEGEEARSRIDHVSPNNVRGAEIAVEYLIERGHRHIALATPDIRTISRAQKHQGVLQAAAASGQKVEVSVLMGRDEEGYGDSQLAALGFAIAGDLVKMASRPTAVVAINDMLAFGLMSGLASHGLEVPRDVSVVGMDNTVMAGYSVPALTCVAMPLPEMAAAMVGRVAERLSTPELPPRKCCSPPGWCCASRSRHLFNRSHPWQAFS
ncbi:LacI family DNA-binding transcriptional regulator [Xylophilus rhododendri]|uniref:LacI family DNA-binding transcriptional regulator n=1 Tax=Xylophilus rhododendri TaxID=2697032 RepID=UPI001E3E70D1|nr:LacI family DNA-binding transcriptional regulator [Xylophilus rhododendri]